MADAAVTMDATTRAALQKLTDIWMPSPVPWTPQTSGWAVLGGIVLTVIIWAALRAVRRYRADGYRREALAELDRIEVRLLDDRERGAALTDIARLLKRAALGGWPRAEVASLSGTRWVAFLRAHAGRYGLSEVAASFLEEREYSGRQPVVNVIHAREITEAARQWIGSHNV
ncbi:protein of unknown function [Tardiphaga sp. OK246]|uniref:DUF4381 domain-containing protein n=1 Tax=Tardiphaga sp. OK246 TaxID=1855307 RepID=UPI000B6B632B|nr:DUF4381 domain-containing protein [Tardiphaga sp. OK246]SNT12082.1 protein of unknown function [Tardiphaga sp. OK246]